MRRGPRIACEVERAARTALLSCASLAAFSAGAAAQDGKLERVSETVRDGFSAAEPDGDWEWGGGFDDGMFALLFEFLMALPVEVPRALLHDEGSTAGFAERPYSGPAGFWLAEPDPGASAWSLRPRLEFGTDFGDLERTGLALQAEHASRLGFEVAWSHWSEDTGGGSRDELELGDANFVVRLAQGPTAAVRAGLGFNWLHDDYGSELGFNSTYAVELLPARPWHAGFELDLGTLGDAFYMHLRAEAGLLLGPLELYAAYDNFDLDGVDLDSLAVGLRGWL